MITEIIYGKDYTYLYFLDSALAFFGNSDMITNERLYKGFNNVPDFDNVLKQLSDDGMIVIEHYGIKITLNGKRKVRKGGYRRAAFLQRLTFFTIIIGCIASIIGAVSILRG